MTYTCRYCYHKQLNKDNNKRNRLSTTYCFLLSCIPYITSDIQYTRGWGKKKHKTHPFSHCILYTIKVKILCYAKKENLFLSSIQFPERMGRSLLSDLWAWSRKVTKRKKQLKVRLRSFLVGYDVVVQNILYKSVEGREGGGCMEYVNRISIYVQM